MSTGFITIPTKKTWEVDVIKPIRDFIADVYTDLTPSDYHHSLVEFGKLRSKVITKLSEKSELALDTLCWYVTCAILISVSPATKGHLIMMSGHLV